MTDFRHHNEGTRKAVPHGFNSDDSWTATRHISAKVFFCKFPYNCKQNYNHMFFMARQSIVGDVPPNSNAFNRAFGVDYIFPHL
jgi:hypothetical protein